MTKDYYKILDIPEFSTQEEVKKAYRRLARKWHPDVAGNSSDSLHMFKEINEAYQILSNNITKADYDKARSFYNYSNKGYQNKTKEKYNENVSKPNFKETSSKNENNTKKKSGFSFNWEEFLANKNRANKFKEENKTRAKKGNDIYSDIEISVFEAINGTTKVINMLQTQLCPHCNGRKFVNGNICHSCNGNGEVSTHKKFSVKIPAGIKNQSKIRLAGEGGKGINGGANGDLYFTVHISEPKGYKTEGLNILKTVQILPHEAVLGTTLSIPTLKGNVSVKIPENSYSGQKIRLSSCGIESATKTGDMILTIEIQIQKTLSYEEIELYKRLKEISSSNIRG